MNAVSARRRCHAVRGAEDGEQQRRRVEERALSRREQQAVQAGEQIPGEDAVLDLVAAVEERAGLHVVVPQRRARMNSPNTTAASGSARQTLVQIAATVGAIDDVPGDERQEEHVHQLGVDEHAGGDGEPADARRRRPLAHRQRALDQPHEDERLQRLGVGRARVDEDQRREGDDQRRAGGPAPRQAAAPRDDEEERARGRHHQATARRARRARTSACRGAASPSTPACRRRSSAPSRPRCRAERRRTSCRRDARRTTAARSRGARRGWRCRRSSRSCRRRRARRPTAARARSGA